MTVQPLLTQPTPGEAQILRRRADLRASAERFVAQTFFTPMFKMMRASPFKSELLSGGRGGEAFTAMLDGVLAERMGRGAGGALVEAIVNRLDPQGARLLRRTSIAPGPPATWVNGSNLDVTR